MIFILLLAQTSPLSRAQLLCSASQYLIAELEITWKRAALDGVLQRTYLGSFHSACCLWTIPWVAKVKSIRAYPKLLGLLFVC